MPDNNAFCAFNVEKGAKWVCVGGDENGQTQVDYPKQVRSCENGGEGGKTLAHCI